MSSPAVSAAPAWRSRIVGSGTEAPDQLLANPCNWRIHGKAQRAALREVLDTVGYVAQVIVNRRTGHLVDGHLRVEEALSHGQPSIPVLYVDLSEDEERLVLASLDPLAAMATTDEVKLRELLGKVLAVALGHPPHRRPYPVLIVGDAPGPGHRRRAFVVIELGDFRDFHGEVVP